MRYGRRQHSRPFRRWPRRLLIATNILVLISLLAVGSAYGYVRWRLDSIRTIAAAHLSTVGQAPTEIVHGKKVKDTADGLLPENILLIGNETRAGLTNPAEIAALGSPSLYSGSLSDVIMILHLDPLTDSASTLSIPRDLFLPMPAGSPVGPYQKIDAALNDGANGPDNLIEAITDDVGIPINHYIELNFDGFEQTVNAIGGINVDFPEPVFDSFSQLDITQTGCQHINGTQALAMVRARHLQYDPPGVPLDDVADWPYDPNSDLARIVRDHTFLDILANTAETKGLTKPVTANAFIGGIINQITIDPGLKNQLIPLITHYRHINPATAPQTTLPIIAYGGADGYVYNGYSMGDIDFPDQPADNRAIAAWDSNALPVPVAPTGVQVDNITYTSQLAATTATALTADGFHVLGTGDATDPATTSETLVNYPTGGLPQAIDVVDHLSGLVMLQPNPTVPAGTIALDVGSNVAVTAPPAAAAAPASTAAPPASTPSMPPAATAPAAATTLDGQTASPSADQNRPWDPRPCTGQVASP